MSRSTKFAVEMATVAGKAESDDLYEGENCWCLGNSHRLADG